MKKSLHFFLLLFFILIFSVPAYWLLRGKPETNVSMVEGRVLGLPEQSYPTLKVAIEYIKKGKPELAVSLVWDLYTGGSLQKKFDGAATDQFPFRIPLINFSKSVDRKIISFVYSFSGDKVIPADMTSDIYIILDEQALIFPPNIFDNQSQEIIKERANNYNQIASFFPNINLYLFYLETLEHSQYNPISKYFHNADNGQSYEYFRSNISDKIILDHLFLQNLDDHLTNFYRTDHHWNIHGISKGYSKIYKMLSKNYPDIPEAFKPSALLTFPNIRFLGTLARRTLYPVEGDKFTGFEAIPPKCEISDQGVKGDYDYRDEYHDGLIPDDPYSRHYGQYFGSQSGLLEYNCETNTNRNILIIGNSYMRPLVPMIATHYEHTYFLDLRQDKTFTLSNFLVNHPVEDILIGGNAEVFFGDDNLWLIKP